MRISLAFLVSVALSAADHGEVLAILGPDRLAIQYYQLPVTVRLAEIEIPADSADAAQAKLGEVTGKKSNVFWAPDLGADDAGMPRVFVTVGAETVSLNEALVAAGLAKAKPQGDGKPTGQTARNRDRLAAAQTKAQRAKTGLWAAAGEPAPAALSAGAGAVAKAPAPGNAKAPFCAEVDGKNYYPSDAPEAARLNPKRLVYYTSEAAAKKAGKQLWQPSAPSAGGTTLEDARAAFGRGRTLVEQAAGQDATPERDKLYERAFLELSSAMQVYSRLAEAKPDDEKLGEEMRQCMQMRYGAMKSKRLH